MSTPTVAYGWGPDGLISKRNLSTSTSSWYEFGPQGETRTLTNGSGSSTDTYYYNAYGEIISSSGSTTNPYRYGGKFGYYTETFTGLELATQRWYSPQLMRWISRDPILYKGGVNLYEYVASRPVKLNDPMGQSLANRSAPRPAVGQPTGRDPNQDRSLPMSCGDPNELLICKQACVAGGEIMESYCNGMPTPQLVTMCHSASMGGVVVCQGYCYARYVD